MIPSGDFQKLVALRRSWLSQWENPASREKLAYEITEIEFKDYSPEEKNKFRRYKKQVAEYARLRIACPDREMAPEQYITEAKPPSTGLKILFGTMELANYGATLSAAFRGRGMEAYTLDFYEHPFQYGADLTRHKYPYKYVEKLAMIEFASELIAEFDIFNFLFCNTLLPFFADLPVYRELGKKTISYYLGGEIRLYSLSSRKNPYYTLAEDTYFKDHHTFDVVNFSNLIIFSAYTDAASGCKEFRDILGLYYEDYIEHPQPIRINDFINDNTQTNERFLIVHAPSNADIKGTKFIATAINALKNIYDFEFTIVQHMPHNEALEIYKKADLIVDQLLAYEHGVLAVEAMALGKPVICHLNPLCLEVMPKDVPLITATPYNIQHVIEWALNNKNEVREIGLRGIQYAKDHHDAEKIVDYLLEKYESIPLKKPIATKYLKRKDIMNLDEINYGFTYLNRIGKSFVDYFIKENYKKFLIDGDNEPAQLLYEILSDPRLGFEVSYIDKDSVECFSKKSIVIITRESGILESAARISSVVKNAEVVTLMELLLLV